MFNQIKLVDLNVNAMWFILGKRKRSDAEDQ